MLILLCLLLCSSTVITAAGDHIDSSPAPDSSSSSLSAASAEVVPLQPLDQPFPAALVHPALAGAAAAGPTTADTLSAGDTASIAPSSEALLDDAGKTSAGNTAEDAADAASGAKVPGARLPIATLPDWDVIVIGAGLAGLKAAADLHTQGYRVIVFEGRNRTGGRVWSTKLDASSTHTVELGAQWLHGSAARNPVYSLVTSSMGVTPLLSDGDSSLRFSRNSTRVPAATVTAFNSRHDAFIAWAEQRDFLDTKSVQAALTDYITAAGLSTTTAANTLAKQGLAYTVNTNIEQEFGASASWLGYNTYDEGLALGNDYVMPRANSLAQIADYIAAGLQAGGFIRLEHNAIQVAYTSTGVTVKVTNRWSTQTFTAQAAVVAIPLGVLKARGTAFFSPVLPTAKQAAITRLGVGLLNKVILEFPATYTTGPFGTADGGAEWINRLPEANGDTQLGGNWQEFFVLKNAVGSPILVAFQAGQPAINAETSMTDTQMVTSVMTQLRLWYGSNMPSPIRTRVTRWWKDPWSLGSYSYASTSCTRDSQYWPKERQAFTTPEKRVWFAGEHVSTQYPATMQGAYVTGQAAASAIIAAGIQKTEPPFG